MNGKLLQSIADNALFVFEFLLVIAATFAIAWLFEKAGKKRRGDTEKVFTTRKLVFIGVFSGISAILYCLDFPVFFAPGFYKLDFGDLPALIGGFAYGPAAGVMIEFVKQLVKLAIKGTSTAFVGDLANFVVGCSFVLPASVIYGFKKTKKSALAACIAGTAVITLVGTLFNAFYLLPAFSKLYGMPLDTIIAMGTAIHPGINGVYSFVFACVAPLNLLKGAINSFVTMLIYKRISPIMKGRR